MRLIFYLLLPRAVLLDLGEQGGMIFLVGVEDEENGSEGSNSEAGVPDGAGHGTCPQSRFEDINLIDILSMGIKYCNDIPENFDDISATSYEVHCVMPTSYWSYFWCKAAGRVQVVLLTEMEQNIAATQAKGSGSLGKEKFLLTKMVVWISPYSHCHWYFIFLIF
ncbi:uncharacterized protein [Triticum aestivum]|uniref:uncharacterized protein isoform X1 n=1 Tax=Triticum aestivum TaxID=4565 RepID=UPI001D03079E|nr:uncharacterized protein LOC123110458 isoform X1 [Triticum aestivum]XP_044386915.1 uncharacterized protein LOC123110458 isoform X1 [Triticum aestivum]